MTTTFVLIATTPGEAITHAGPGCTDVILTDSARRGRGKIYAADEIRVTDTALDDDHFPEIMSAITDAIVPPNPTVVPLFPGLIHKVPRGQDGDAPCCRRAVLELPATDRLVQADALVTCGRYSARIEQLTGLRLAPWQRAIVDRIVASAGTATDPAWDGRLTAQARTNATCVCTEPIERVENPFGGSRWVHVTRGRGRNHEPQPA